MTLRSCLRAVMLLAIAACLPAPSRSTAAPAPAPPAAEKRSTAKPSTAKPSTAKPSTYAPRNHHLHVSATSAGSSRTPSVHERTSHPTHVRSTTTSRRLRHTPRAMATISGTVHDARGSPAASARVWLAKGNGRRIRNPRARHGTHADTTGGFSMRTVKAGRYRVVAAKRGSGRGHNALTIRTGGPHHANVTLKGGRAKARRRR